MTLGSSSAHAGLPPLVVDPTTQRQHQRLLRIDAASAILELEGGSRRRVLLLDPGPGVQRREVVVDGWRVEVEVEPERLAALRERAARGRDEAAHAGPTEVRAIIPGVIVSVSVVEGDDVVAGQQLLVVEAMKMQNELRAPREGRVTRLAVGAGQTVEVGSLLLVLE